jgi:hypothetical protein
MSICLLWLSVSQFLCTNSTEYFQLTVYSETMSSRLQLRLRSFFSAIYFYNVVDRLGRMKNQMILYIHVSLNA